MKYFLISIVCILASWLLVNLMVMWMADKSFAYGKNLDSIQRFVEAYPFLKESVDKNPDEPTFRDELAFNQAILASALHTSATESAQQLAMQAITNSDKVITDQPNSMPFWKSRTRLFYQLATMDPKYYLDALTAIKKAAELAPTDAKVHYNLGVLLAKTGQIPAAIKAFEETLILKPDYTDAKTILEQIKTNK